ncbi:MAG: hypothetical protein QMC38_14170, partial [Sinobacterium sp.]
MNFNKTSMALIFGTLILVGCGGGGTETDPVAESAIINTLDTITELTEQGQVLQVIISCTDCLSSLNEYSWSIDGVIISATDNYVLKMQDFNKEIRIDVSVNNNNNLADTTYKVIVPSRIQVTEIYSNTEAFSALKSNGNVVTWGDNYTGGDSSAVELTNIVDIYSNIFAFAALKTDGSV